MLAGLVRAGNGVEVGTPRGTLLLDPGRATAPAVVTHAHTDHLPSVRGRGVGPPPEPPVMTAPTLDLLRLRRPGGAGRAVPYGETTEVAGARVTLLDAGHVCGSAMVRVETDAGTLLYTGDFSPAGGTTSGRARPEPCDLLVVESTYGDPRFEMPPRELVLANLETWLLRKLLGGSVALGAHELGRAQELVAFLNRAGIVPVVSMEIARIAAVYNAHGHDLAWTVLGSPAERETGGNACYVVPKAHLKRGHPFTARLAGENGAGALLTGWAQVYSYFSSYAIEAQFPLTDHATFPELLAFVSACAPKEVRTVHGRPEALASEIERRLGLKARAL